MSAETDALLAIIKRHLAEERRIPPVDPDAPPLDVVYESPLVRAARKARP